MGTDNKESFALLHCHTTDSVRDSVMSIDALLERAVEVGAKAVAKTEHGTLIGYNEFWQKANEKGLKPILGVEAYVTENYEKEGDRRHLILMAKDNEGFKAISKAVTESNEHIEKAGKFTFPLMDKELLRKWFGRGSKGYGHVYATSACVSGVIAGIWYQSLRLDEKVKKLKERQKAFLSPESDEALKAQNGLSEALSEQERLQKELAGLKKSASRPTTALSKKVTSAKTDEARKAAETALNAVISEKEKAEKLLPDIIRKKSEADSKVKETRASLSQVKASVERWKALYESIRKEESQKLSEAEMMKKLEEEAKWFKNLFAKNDFFMELQYHGMREEKYIYPRLARIAVVNRIPMVAANDAHIPTGSEENVRARQLIRATVFDRWEDPTDSEREMYVKDADELYDALHKILPGNVVEMAIKNTLVIAENCNVELRKEDHYPKFKAPDGMSSEKYLTKLAYEGIATRYGNRWTKTHEERLKHELNVICSMGYADYHCIVRDFLEYARLAGKLDLTDPKEIGIAESCDIEKIRKVVAGRPGECVGPGRGSAAGSIVCYLIGITNIDPVRYGLLFERFLNPERVSMPDIDCDIESNVRPYVIGYVKHKYGEDSVCGIMTKGTLAGKAAIQAAARVCGIRKKDDSTAYRELGDALSKKAAECAEDELHLKLRDVEEEVLKTFSSDIAAEVYSDAMLIEGAATQIGQHAAGIIIADGHPVSDYVPLCWNEKNSIMTTQVDMVEAEAMGLLKMDFLGLNNLTIITETLRSIEKATGKVIDMDSLPFEDDVFEKIFSTANTNSVFQFESAGMKSMLKQFKPSSIDDIVLLVAMFRPGPLQFLPDVIKVKQGKEQISYLTPELEHILQNTYGSIVYQEQVQQIFRDLAGYSLGQADVVRRAMSKKKLKVIEAERKAFLDGDPERHIEGCVPRGISRDAADRLFDQMTEFAAYAFNKSHAACYAVVAYQTAWLKFHYPAEYMAAVLNNTAFEKYGALLNDLKEMGVQVRTPDINESGLGFTVKDGSVLYGLGSVKGLGDSVANIIAERKVNGPYRSAADLIIRANAGKTALESLSWCGAFESFTDGRKMMAEAVPELLKVGKKYRDTLKKLESETDDGRRLKTQETLKELKDVLENVRPNIMLCDDWEENLSKEEELLGAFVSKEPVDLYDLEGTDTVSDAMRVNDGTMLLLGGVVTDLRVRSRKSDGKPMAFFKIKDSTGVINVSCFTGQFEKYGKLLEEGKALKIYGKVSSSENYGRQLAVSTVSVPERKTEKIMVEAKDIDDWMMNVRKKVIAYVVGNGGNELMIHDSMIGEYRKTGLFVTPLILKDETLNAVRL